MFNWVLPGASAVKAKVASVNSVPWKAINAKGSVMKEIAPSSGKASNSKTSLPLNAEENVTLSSEAMPIVLQPSTKFQAPMPLSTWLAFKSMEKTSPTLTVVKAGLKLMWATLAALGSACANKNKVTADVAKVREAIRRST